jgi:hypothetical protein
VPFRDLYAVVGRPGVDDHDLVDDVADGAQAVLEDSCLVPDDEGGGQSHGMRDLP